MELKLATMFRLLENLKVTTPLCQAIHIGMGKDRKSDSKGWSFKPPA